MIGMEYLLFSVVIILFLAAYFIGGYINYRKSLSVFGQKLRKQYGMAPQREYEAKQFASISHYYEKHKQNEMVLDDITWNDLEMDLIFKRLNSMQSSAGEEYLYDMLRRPQSDKSHFEEMERIISYFDEHEEERIKLQLECARLGRTGDFSLFDYLEFLNTLGHRNNKKHYLTNFLYLPALALIPFYSGAGILILVGLICYNIMTYFKDKKEIDPYITSFAYVLRLLECVDRVIRLGIPELDGYCSRMKEKRRKFRKFKRSAGWVMGGGRGITSSNPLEMLLDYLRMVFHLDLIKFNQMLKEVSRNTEETDDLVSTIGFLEACIAVGSFRKSISYYTIPDFADKKVLEIDELYHPLLDGAVANSIRTDRGVLLTGSNASGKSTFLKAVALNAVLAQTVHTCTARTYRGAFYRIFTSMALRDSLIGGESYFIVEIKALKRILDAASDNTLPVLCFVDEVLRGTNTIERVAASTQILRSLRGGNVLCFAATHDIELTHLLERDYENYHFTEEVTEGDIHFNYQLRNGRAESRNAIRLLGLLGYEKDIIEKAGNMAERFLESGKWELGK